MLSHWLIDNVLDWWTGWCFDFLTGRLSDYLIGLTFGWLIDEMILFLKTERGSRCVAAPLRHRWDSEVIRQTAQTWLADLVLLHIFKQSKNVQIHWSLQGEERSNLSWQQFHRSLFYNDDTRSGSFNVAVLWAVAATPTGLLCPAVLKEQFL